jgi:hypothetical protein
MIGVRLQTGSDLACEVLMMEMNMVIVEVMAMAL